MIYTANIYNKFNLLKDYEGGIYEYNYETIAIPAHSVLLISLIYIPSLDYYSDQEISQMSSEKYNLFLDLKKESVNFTPILLIVGIVVGSLLFILFLLYFVQ